MDLGLEKALIFLLSELISGLQISTPVLGLESQVWSHVTLAMTLVGLAKFIEES
jgi:hypothetical protein